MSENPIRHCSEIDETAEDEVYNQQLRLAALERAVAETRLVLDAKGHEALVVAAQRVVAARTLPPFAPLMAVLQAQKDELGHIVTMDALAFQLILEFPEQAARVAGEALVRIQRSAA